MSRDICLRCLATSQEWAGKDSNLRRLSRQIYSLLPLAAWVPTRPDTHDSFLCVPSFDVVSEVDLQEVRNAVDQTAREVSTRFDFKGTDSTVELGDGEIQLHSATDDRLRALIQVLEEKLVRRSVSLKSLEYGKVEEAAKGAVRQVVKINAGISDVKAREINRLIKDRKTKGVSSQTQGDQVRVTGKKRDDLQAVIAALKEHDFGVPLQFKNFRD